MRGGRPEMSPKQYIAQKMGPGIRARLQCRVFQTEILQCLAGPGLCDPVQVVQAAREEARIEVLQGPDYAIPCRGRGFQDPGLDRQRIRVRCCRPARFSGVRGRYAGRLPKPKDAAQIAGSAAGIARESDIMRPGVAPKHYRDRCSERDAAKPHATPLSHPACTVCGSGILQTASNLP